MPLAAAPRAVLLSCWKRNDLVVLPVPLLELEGMLEVGMVKAMAKVTEKKTTKAMIL